MLGGGCTPSAIKIAERGRKIKGDIQMANKSANLMIRVSEIDKEKIKQAAEERQMSMSEWVLFLIRKELDEREKHG